METLLALFAERRPPDVTALLTLVDGTVVTYGDAERRSAQLANLLAARGARPGDRVAVQIEKSPLAVLLYFACLRAGLVFLPMNTAYTAEEVAYLIDDAEPAVVVRPPTDDLLAEAAGHADHFDDVGVGPDDVAAILYTSGTTGRPKGAMLTHHNLASNARALHQAWGFRPDDVLLHALPVFHAHGLFVAVNCVLANGTGMIFLPRFDVDMVLERLPEATVFMGVPTFYTRLLADDRLDADRCRRMRLFVSGSAPLSPATHEEFRRRTGHVILERYGMTETTMISSNPLDGERRPGSVGRPLPGVQVRITQEGAAVGPGEVGDVEVRGPNVFRGYWKRPSAAEFTSDGFFRTGDLGRLDADGYLHLVGRSKDLVISGGLNVYPKEVEEVLDSLPGVAESAVIGVPDPDLGEAVVAVVVAEPGAELQPDALRAEARRHLAGFKVPKRVQVAESLPRNTMGKVEKARLRSWFA
ncbi:MAG TPA: AMP-binding protein [Acidimicrobiales bacterium]|nr:AMP-binding protein [Acidimicrobiales bacterium]